MTLIYSNPRKQAIIPNWPMGANKRGDAYFHVEYVPGRGERAVRVTTGKPKKRTYSDKVWIVDGSDGKVYIAEFSARNEMVTIMRGDMKYREESDSAIHPGPRWSMLRALFEDATTPTPARAENSPAADPA